MRWWPFRKPTETDVDEWEFTSGTLGWFDRDEDGDTWFTFGEPPETEEELAAVRQRRASQEEAE